MNTTRPTECDVIVVGGGMVGGLLAATLAASGFEVVVLEATPPRAFSPDEPFDLRVSALSLASERMLRTIGAWEHVQKRRACPYQRMQVWDGELGGETSFFSGDIGETHLGHIVENRILQLALTDALQAQQRVHLACPAVLSNVQVNENAAEVILEDGQRIKARLVVGADGANSRVRELASIASGRKCYPQRALVATIRTSIPQQSVTWQRFLPSGPQAFLPLPDQHASMVWYHGSDEIQRLGDLPDDEFVAELEAAFPVQLGAVEKLIGRGSFPLHRSHAERYVKPRIALVGDAAHTVHPLAGQGVNLGLLDAACLAEIIVRASRSNHDIGHLHRLRPYERWRRGENALMIQVLDGFYQAFKPQPPAICQLRSMALNVADRLAPMKRLVIRHATGTAGDLPMLAQWALALTGELISVTCLRETGIERFAGYLLEKINVNESVSGDEDDGSGAAEEPHPSTVCTSLLAKMKTLQLASLDENGWPYCSYAPFLYHAHSFYVFISELAAHTRHVLDSGKAAVMIVADEADSAQIFARTRVYYQCDVHLIPRKQDDQPNPEFDRLLNNYEQRHGKTVSLLRSLADFHLVQLTPRNGLFVMGFGQAFKLSGPELGNYTHVRSA